MLRRIVLLNDHAWPSGGAAAVALAEAEGLARRGYEVHFIGGVGGGAQDAPKGWTLHPLRQADLATAGPRALVRGLWNAKAAKALETTWNAGHPDDTVVHIHGWSKLLTSSVVRKALQLQAPTLMTLHEYSITCPNGGFYDYPADTICRRRPLGVRCTFRNCDKQSYLHKAWRVLRSHIERHIGRIHDPRLHYLTVTEFARQVQARHLPQGRRIQVLSNPVLRESSTSEGDRGNHFLFIGRMSQEKGAELLAGAARKSGASVTFVGDGPELARLRDSFPEFTFLGRVADAEVVRQLDHARALVVPSLWYETQGMVVAEAAARGLPVIAPEGTAPGAAIEDDWTGLLFARGDMDSLAEHLADLSGDGQKASRMGREASCRFQEADAGLEAHLDQLVAHYESALKGSQRRA